MIGIIIKLQRASIFKRKSKIKLTTSIEKVMKEGTKIRKMKHVSMERSAGY